MNLLEEMQKGLAQESSKEMVRRAAPKVLGFLGLYSPPVFYWLLTRLSARLLLVLVIAELLSLSIAGSYIAYLRREYIPKLTHKFGIQWDQELNPHCPKCSKRLGPYQVNQYRYPGFECFDCKDVRRLLGEDANGELITYEAAMKELREWQNKSLTLLPKKK